MYVKKIDHKGLLSWAFCGTAENLKAQASALKFFESASKFEDLTRTLRIIGSQN